MVNKAVTNIKDQVSDLVAEYSESKGDIEAKYTLWKQPLVNNSLYYFLLEEIIKLKSELKRLQCDCKGDGSARIKKSRPKRTKPTVQN